MGDNLTASSQSTAKVVSSGEATKFINFVEKRFGVYLDTIQGFNFNLQLITSHHNLDVNSIRYGVGIPSSDVNEFTEKTLHKRTLRQFKEDNDIGGKNAIFAIHNCLSDICNQWNILKKGIEINDKNEISVMTYIGQLRNRTQHELYDDQNVIKANSVVEIKEQLSIYSFPR